MADPIRREKVNFFCSNLFSGNTNWPIVKNFFFNLHYEILHSLLWIFYLNLCCLSLMHNFSPCNQVFHDANLKVQRKKETTCNFKTLLQFHEDFLFLLKFIAFFPHCTYNMFLTHHKPHITTYCADYYEPLFFCSVVLLLIVHQIALVVK